MRPTTGMWGRVHSGRNPVAVRPVEPTVQRNPRVVMVQKLAYTIRRKDPRFSLIIGLADSGARTPCGLQDRGPAVRYKDLGL